MNKIGSLPEFPNSRSLEVDDKAILDALFKQLQPQISELTFTNLFVWNEAEPVQLSRLDTSVLLQRRRLRDAKDLLLPPLSEEPILSIIKRLTEKTANKQPGLSLYGVDRDEATELSADGYGVESDRDDWDYVYLSSDLADLPGDKYHSKRNFIKRCLSAHKCEYKGIDAQVVKDCLQLQTEWCNLRKCDAVQGLEAENNAIKKVFDNYGLFGVSGGAVYIDGKLEAFAVAEPLNLNTAVMHFEKANPQIIGLYQLINQWFCKNALRTFTFINREQDLGLPGLRNAKLSYHPHRMIEKFVVTVT